MKLRGETDHEVSETIRPNASALNSMASCKNQT
jgi:hypothetical protein